MQNAFDRMIAPNRFVTSGHEQGYREQALKIYPWICGRCARGSSSAKQFNQLPCITGTNHDNNPRTAATTGVAVPLLPRQRAFAQAWAIYAAGRPCWRQRQG